LCQRNPKIKIYIFGTDVKLEPALPVFIVLAYQSILIMRMYALHNKNLILLISFVVLLLGEAACVLICYAFLQSFPD